MIAFPVVSSEALWGLLTGALGSLVLVTGIAFPILKRQFSRQREQLRSEHERWSLVLEANHDGIFDADIRTRSAFYSPHWFAQLGYHPKELPSTYETWLQRVHPDDRLRVEKQIADYLAHRAATCESEYRLRHRNGHWCWIHLRAQAVWDERGRAVRLVGSNADITARKQAEADLKASEALMSTFLENNPALTFIKDEEGRLIYANRKPFPDYPGEVADLIGKLDSEIWPPELAAQIHAADLAAFQSETAQESVDTFVLPNGSVCELLATKFAFRDAGGRRFLGGMVLDVTERRNAAEAVHKSEERHRELFERNPLPAWIYNTETFRICEVNEAAIAHYGWSREEFLRLRVDDIRLPDEAAALEAALAKLSSHEPSGPWRHRRKDGSTIWVEIAVQDLRSTSSPLRLSLMLDITARIHAEDEIRFAHDRLETLVEERTTELRESKLKWKALVETLPQIVWAAGPGGEADYMSPRAAEFTGLPLADLQGGKWLNLVHPHDRERVGALWQASISSGSRFDVEVRLRSKSGDYRWYKNLGVPVRDASGRINRWIGTGTDIEDQKRSEGALEDAVARRTLELAEARDRAEAATRAKSQFLAAMSHEIRTPMNGVIGMASLMLDTDLTSQQRCFMDTIRSSGEALMTVINDILDLSKIEAGRLALEQTPFDLSTLLDEATELVASQAASKGLSLSCKVGDSVPLDLLGDPIRLRQVVLNLLSNAVKFTAHGSVSLSVTREATQNNLTILRFAIKDTGIGLTPQQQEGLFQAFAQGEISISRRFGGTGLGLAISKRLVEMMGGTIGVHSQPGEGSTFWFNVCLESVSVFEDAHCFHGKHIALVSSDAQTAQTISSYLDSVGVNVSTFPNIPRPEHKHFDLLLIDSASVLPFSTGLWNAFAVPVFILGCKADLKWLTTDQTNGTAFIEKPVRRLPLLHALQAIFEGKAANPLTEEQRDQAAVSLQGARILLAEDNKVNQLVAKLLLEKLNCTVDIVENGVEACTAVQRQKYDLVLMDCQMPTMSGFEAAQRIRAFETSGRRTPIIALTAGVLKEERDRCYASGMDDFLSKPISPKDLRTTLSKWHTSYAEPHA